MNMNNWTPVAKRLPKERGQYLVYRPFYDDVRIVNYGTSKKWENGRDKMWPKEHRISHWMPIPTPPEEEK